MGESNVAKKKRKTGKGGGQAKQKPEPKTTRIVFIGQLPRGRELLQMQFEELAEGVFGIAGIALEKLGRQVGSGEEQPNNDMKDLVEYAACLREIKKNLVSDSEKNDYEKK